MSSHARHFKNDSLNDLPKPDYHTELLSSLERINTYNPPVHTCSTGWSFSGLYKGPTSIGFLFHRLSQLYPDLTFKSQSLLEWAEAYLKLSEVHVTRKADVDPDHCGIANETLSYLAVNSVISNDASLAQKLCAYESTMNDKGGSNEWLYGRAGYLYLLRLCRTHFNKQQQASVTKSLEQTIERTVNRIMSTPLPWTWHGKQYMGAAHGYFGIVAQLVLSLPDSAQKLESLVSDLLDTQFESGNFPSSIEGFLGKNAMTGSDKLVQFCHGAPGFVTSLEPVKMYFSSEIQSRITRALESAKDDICKRGLLTKSPCLCHGIAGNAPCFTDSKDDRFEKFLVAMSTEQIEANARGGRGGLEKGWMEDAGQSDGFAGLWTGEAGRAWVWAVADRKDERRLLGFNDV
ncbi:hypothetical protein PMZ80_010875 [Knufia obscura]|uniref:Uncharacterized protein n=1 Tax=Knufia obscura TaxID=1635080 RepID=A0ABR0R9K4_9EURO|nr:hypothetical protein PMZ80_010875 [Knufia obscura]